MGIEALQLAFGDTAGRVKLYDFASADGSTQASLSRESVGLSTHHLTEHEVPSTTLHDDARRRSRMIPLPASSHDHASASLS
jgi:hypothetical protein